MLEIAADEFTARMTADEVPRPVRLSLRQPAPDPHPDGGGNWVCELVADGLDAAATEPAVYPVVGGSSWQAVVLAASLGRSLLQTELERGTLFAYSDDWSETFTAETLDALFGLTAVRVAPSASEAVGESK